MNTVIINGAGLLTGKNKGQWESFPTLNEANKFIAECCGVYCCENNSELRLPDKTDNKVGTIYFEGNVLKAKLPSGTLVTVTVVAV